jgi:hypothetical protein
LNAPLCLRDKYSQTFYKTHIQASRYQRTTHVRLSARRMALFCALLLPSTFNDELRSPGLQLSGQPAHRLVHLENQLAEHLEPLHQRRLQTRPAVLAQPVIAFAPPLQEHQAAALGAQAQTLLRHPPSLHGRQA